MEHPIRQHFTCRECECMCVLSCVGEVPSRCACPSEKARKMKQYRNPDWQVPVRTFAAPENKERTATTNNSESVEITTDSPCDGCSRKSKCDHTPESYFCHENFSPA